MDDLSRAPSKLEQSAGAIAAAVLTLIFAGIAVAIWLTSPGAMPAVGIFSVLCLTSAVLFYRAAFTARRSLSSRATSRLSHIMIVIGCASLALGLFAGSARNHLLLLGPGLSCLAYGLAGVGRRDR